MAKKKFDVRSHMRNVDTIKKKEIDLTEWGFPKGSIFAKTLTAFESNQITKNAIILKQGIDKNKATPDDYETADDFIFQFIVQGTCDADGDQIFEKEDVEILQQKAKKMIDTIYAAVEGLNGVTESKVEQAVKK